MLNLKEIVRERPIAILLHGSSIKYLEDNIEQLKDIDLCYASLNLFRIMEEKILSKIDKKLELVYCSNDKEFKTRLPDIQSFVSRENVKIVTTFNCMRDAETEKIVNNNITKFHFVKQLMFSQNIYPNSLANFLYALFLEGLRKVILFGCDGLLNKEENVENMSNTYFGKEILQKEKRDWNLINDTINFNNHFADCMNKEVNINQTDVDVVNCSADSFITSFHRIKFKNIQNWVNTKDKHFILTPVDFYRNEVREKLAELLQNEDTLESFDIKTREIYKKYRELISSNLTLNFINEFRDKMITKLQVLDK